MDLVLFSVIKNIKGLLNTISSHMLFKYSESVTAEASAPFSLNSTEVLFSDSGFAKIIWNNDVFQSFFEF